MAAMKSAGAAPGVAVPPSPGGSMSATQSEVRSLGSAVAGIAEDLLELVSKERQLAQAEMAESATAAKRAGMYGGIAGVLGLFVIGFLALSLMYGLDTVMPQWLAALVTAVIIGALVGLLAWLAKRALADFTLVPSRTTASVKEDLRWASEQIKRNATSSANGSSSASGSRS